MVVQTALSRPSVDRAAHTAHPVAYADSPMMIRSSMRRVVGAPSSAISSTASRTVSPSGTAIQGSTRRQYRPIPTTLPCP